MCRWIAYNGESVKLERFIISPAHSLLRQGTQAKMLKHPDGTILNVNGDGYGAGWYSGEDVPCVIKEEIPVWNSENFKNICHHTSSGLFMAHVRLTTTGEVHRENSHPFSYKNWLFQHNGYITNFHEVQRDLQMDIAPELYPCVRGTTDSETFFYLALTYGLEKDPKAAMEKLYKRLCAANEKRGEGSFNLSCAFSDGKRLYTIRAADGVDANTQFYSNKPECLDDFEDNDTFLPDGSVLVVSEPLNDLSDKWEEVPAGSFVTIKNGDVDVQALELS